MSHYKIEAAGLVLDVASTLPLAVRIARRHAQECGVAVDIKQAEGDLVVAEATEKIVRYKLRGQQ